MESRVDIVENERDDFESDPPGRTFVTNDGTVSSRCRTTSTVASSCGVSTSLPTWNVRSTRPPADNGALKAPVIRLVGMPLASPQHDALIVPLIGVVASIIA